MDQSITVRPGRSVSLSPDKWNWREELEQIHVTLKQEEQQNTHRPPGDATLRQRKDERFLTLSLDRVEPPLL